MRKIYFTIFLTLLWSLVLAQETKTEVLILGTVHFFVTKDDSITSPKKQQELAVILNQLRLFAPQQIFIENPPENDKFYLEILQEIEKSGKDTQQKWIINNEIYQIGIRLCSQLKLHTGVEGIDWRTPNPEDSIIIYTNGYEKAYVNFIKKVEEYTLKRATLSRDSLIMDKEGFKIVEKYNKELLPYYSINSKISLKNILLYANNPANSKKWYYANRLPNLLSDVAGIGAEMNNADIFRDFRIYRNALNKLREQTKRVLIIYGAAHAHILSDLFSMDERFKVIEAGTVIK
ncbi:DUF5694 domain-containing protein [Spirosoma fluviale]|nr:DUF5694 domain-containing protein [Spirosoma fluviale]